MPEVAQRSPQRCRQRDILQLLSKDRYCQAGPLIRLLPGLLEAAPYGSSLFGGDLGLIHEILNVVAVSLVRWYASGGRVRSGDEALLRKVGHLVANGGRAGAKRIPAVDSVGRHSDAGGDVLPDYDLQDDSLFSVAAQSCPYPKLAVAGSDC